MFLCRRLSLVGRSFQNSVRGFSSINKKDPYSSRLDCRPKALQARVDFLIRLQDLDTAAKHARLAAFSKSGVRDDDNLDQSFKYIDQTCDAIVEAMCEAKRYKDALELFHYFYRDSKIKPRKGYFNHIIKSYLDQGRLEDALNLYDSSMADTITEYHISKGLVDAGRVDEAMDRLEGKLHSHSVSTVVRQPLFEGLLRQGDIETANEVFGQVWGKCHVHHRLYKYDKVAVLSCKFMEYWLEQGKEEEAKKCYDHLELSKLTEATTVNALLDLLLRYGKTNVAWSLFNEVLNSEEKHNVDSGTLIIMVNVCFKMGRFDWAIQIFHKVKASKLEKPQVRCYRHIITKLTKQGILFEAEQLFEEMCSDASVKPDVSTYTTMINAYVKAGRSEDALRLSNKMVDVFLGQVALLACI